MDGAPVKRVLRASALLLVIVCVARLSAAPPECTCATARDTNGWCEVHHAGYVASVRITSRLLYDALDAHGHTLDLGTFTCVSCRKAIETDGFCDRDSVGFVKGQVYLSRLTYELARGERMDPSTIKCKVCRANALSQGWCDRCKLGMVGNVAIRDREAYDRAARAADIVRGASQTVARCEWCGVAMVTSTKCPICRITYRDGKPVP